MIMDHYCTEECTGLDVVEWFLQKEILSAGNYLYRGKIATRVGRHETYYLRS